MAEISVIVPVYNAEKYLPRCLRSIQEQTIFGQMEVILVNDGSTDASGRICDEFAAQHANVRVLHKENGGVSSARKRRAGRGHGRVYRLCRQRRLHSPRRDGDSAGLFALGAPKACFFARHMCMTTRRRARLRRPLRFNSRGRMCTGRSFCTGTASARAFPRCTARTSSVRSAFRGRLHRRGFAVFVPRAVETAPRGRPRSGAVLRPQAAERDETGEDLPGKAALCRL